MTKLEAWKKFNEAVPGLEATEHTLEKSSHGKAFSFAWDAAVETEREARAKLTKETVGDKIYGTCVLFADAPPARWNK